MNSFNHEDSPRTNYGAMYEEEKKVMKINLKSTCYGGIIEIDGERYDGKFILLDSICEGLNTSYEEEYADTCESCGEWITSTTYELPDELRECIFKLCIND